LFVVEGKTLRKIHPRLTHITYQVVVSAFVKQIKFFLFFD